MFKIGNIAVIGLGYVGLPLAVEFGKKFPTTGFDINETRINELRQRIDTTLEVEPHELAEATSLNFTADPRELSDCNIYIVTVPTPIDEFKTPDLTPLCKASETVGHVIDKGDVVIFESTVYPGATEDTCVPILESKSGLKCNTDFFVGYSPERINPGDKEHRLPSIKKVTSGSTPEAAIFIDQMYKEIIVAGTHLAPSIKVAEAAKVIENTQRDVNIALINELALIFDRLDINTQDVLDAAGTKWNFLPFHPGLVGGHCIGVDPYYLTHKAQSAGYHPEIVLSGRRINDSMGFHIANSLIRKMIASDIAIKTNRVLVLGLTFKENCPDLRNTRVIDIVSELEKYGLEVDVADPNVEPALAHQVYDINLVDRFDREYDSIVYAVAHDVFKSDFTDSKPSYCADKHIIFDVKSQISRNSGLSVIRL